MRTTATVGAVLLLAVGVGRGDPPSAPATPVSPPPTAAPLPSLPPIPPADNLPWKTDGKLWQRPQPIDTPAPLPPVDKPAASKAEPPADQGAKLDRPDAKKLKEEVEKLLKESTDQAKGKAESTPTGNRTELLKELEDLVGKIEQQKKSPKPATPPKPANPNDHPSPHGPQPGKPLVPDGGGKPIDLVRAAGNLYKSGDPEGAFETLKVIDTNQLPKEDRAFADYVKAACLRKLGRTNDALKLYRAIADAKDDPFLAESAVVQMTAIKSAQELETQLEQLKSRRKPK